MRRVLFGYVVACGAWPRSAACGARPSCALWCLDRRLGLGLRDFFPWFLAGSGGGTPTF